MRKTTCAGAAVLMLVALVTRSDPAAAGPDAPLEIGVRASRTIVPVGGSTRITVGVRDKDGLPVPGADVLVAAGGGYFGNGMYPRISGLTNPGGAFRTRWRTLDPSVYTGDMSYQLAVTVRKPGYVEATATLMVKVVVDPVKAPAGILLHATASPATVAPGGATVVTVRTRKPDGSPLPGATVQVTAGGGHFGDTLDPAVRGVTDANGMFRARWRTLDPNVYAGGGTYRYEMAAEAAAGGYSRARTSVVVAVRPGGGTAPPGARVLMEASHTKVRPRGSSLITVTALAADGSPLAGAEVRVGAGEGTFDGTPDREVEGVTDAQGRFRTRWRAMDASAYPVADGAYPYVLTARVTRPSGTVALADVRLVVQASGGSAGPASAALGVRMQMPVAVAPGGRAPIKVIVRDPSGAPVPGADVALRCDGGAFVTTNATTAEGRTGPQGGLAVGWATGAAASYGAGSTTRRFQALVTTPGYGPAAARGQTDVKSID